MHSDPVLEYSHFEEIGSTNDYLRGLSPCADITVVSASYQTHGRGQQGSAWISDRGQNLLFSVLLSPNALLVEDAFVLSQAMALSLKRVLDAYTDDVSIKWPNDIYCNGKKICGTLIENSIMGKRVGRSIIGSGLNVNQKEFPQGLAAPATSLFLLTGDRLDPGKLLRSVLNHFSSYYSAIQSGCYHRIREEYHNCLYLKGERAIYQDEKGLFEGTISHVDNDGTINIQDDTMVIRRYAFKQIKFLHRY